MSVGVCIGFTTKKKCKSRDYIWILIPGAISKVWILYQSKFFQNTYFNRLPVFHSVLFPEPPNSEGAKASSAPL